ncbi:MAG: cell envelope biogenesis protein TolA [Comamonadaceae bacterium CG_4_9_14_3_um_filter_60_33]|nr:MAG: cell envelope biogenesis protein TolA [Comamonadaceae bacterium CG_4_9_14_3_um_filter_60_33]
MNISRAFKTSFIVAALLSFSVAQAATLPKADYNVGKTRISAEYKADKKACDALKDNANDVCIEEAKAAQTKALADAKMNKQIGEAKKEATEEKMDASYELAIEKCDAMTGDAKTNCVAAAKAKYGKN